MQPIQAVTWADDGDGVRILDQRLLPEREVYRVLRSVDEVCEAINTLAVRGAPAIGIAAAMGLAMSIPAGARGDVGLVLADADGRLRGTRPTAVNLARALDRVMQAGLRHRDDGAAMRDTLRDEATKILDEDRAMCRRIGEHGATLMAERCQQLMRASDEAEEIDIRYYLHDPSVAVAAGDTDNSLLMLWLAIASGLVALGLVAARLLKARNVQTA